MHRLLEVLGVKGWQGANFWPKFPSKSTPVVTIDLNEAQFSHKLWQIGGFCCSQYKYFHSLVTFTSHIPLRDLFSLCILYFRGMIVFLFFLQICLIVGLFTLCSGRGRGDRCQPSLPYKPTLTFTNTKSSHSAPCPPWALRGLKGPSRDLRDLTLSWFEGNGECWWCNDGGGLLTVTEVASNCPAAASSASPPPARGERERGATSLLPPSSSSSSSSSYFFSFSFSSASKPLPFLPPPPLGL